MVMTVKDLVVGYKANAPVAGPISLTVADGEMVLLKGPNGSGKTTFLKTVASLLKPLSGTIDAPDAILIPTRIPKVKGFTVTEFIRTFLSFAGGSAGCIIPSSRKIWPMSSGVTQPSENILSDNNSSNSGISSDISVRNMFGRNMSGYTTPGDIGHIISETGVVYPDILAKMGISELANRDISTLSDGQFQKVCLCPAVASGKKLILLDEPTAFLDAESRVNFMQFLQSLPATVLFSSHDLAVCEPFCTQVISIQKF